ncbi:lipopolysaccharide heptosyltransferase II [soil metagenome]
MNILVRLPNWLGDMVMATGFIRELQRLAPESRIDLILKKELADLAAFMPGVSRVYLFSKAQYPGLKGALAFGRQIAAQRSYNVFFSLPDSFSSALMGWASGSPRRVGYRKEFRSLLLSHAYAKPQGKHRVEEYVYLLERYFKVAVPDPQVKLSEPAQAGTAGALATQSPAIVLNFNSEAQSRRMPVEKAVRIVNRLRQETEAELILIGSPKEVPFVDQIMAGLQEGRQVRSEAGNTTLPQLAHLIRSADLMISTDSGPAHLAYSQGTKLLVFFGAGDEANTGPYRSPGAEVMRVPGMPCAAYHANTCKFGTPLCLLQLDEDLIVSRAQALLV